MNTAIHSIISKQREARFWQYVALVLVILFTAITAYREFVPKPQPNILLVSEQDYRVVKLANFAEANQLHKDQAEIATLCLFQRSPRGADYHDRIGKLFSPDAFDKAHKLIDSERREFTVKSLHQKVEIAEINILKVRGNTVLSKVTGQLIRTGSFESKPFIEVLKLEANIQFVRNPDIAANGFYPSIVTAFEINTTPIATR